jgi:hypothetical protein
MIEILIYGLFIVTGYFVLFGNWKRYSAKEVLVLSLLVASPGLARSNWKTFSSNHFRIFYSQNDAYAKKVAAYAEEQRTDLIKRWFSDATSWPVIIDVYLYESEEHIVLTAGARNWMAGSTNVDYDAGRAVSSRISVRIDLEMVWEDVFPHELMHALGGSYFGRSIPRWIDEGLAGQVESGESLKKRRMWAASTDRYTIKQLIKMDDYPEQRYVKLYYGQSVMLINHLVKRKNEKEFIKFVVSVGRVGVESALQKHYNISCDQLEKDWLVVPASAVAEVTNR